MALLKRSHSPPRSDDEKPSKHRRRDGFSEATTFQIAEQVALAKVSTGLLLREMKKIKTDDSDDEINKDSKSLRLQEETQEKVRLPVSKTIVPYLMTPEHRIQLVKESGAEVEWFPGESKVNLVGSRKSISTAKRFLARIEMHCRWGVTVDKVSRLLRRHQGVESVLLRLSPMTVNKLLPAEKMFNMKQTTLTIGKDPKNNVVVSDVAISRQHCVVVFDHHKGSVYVTDLSTNGTFLNGVRLPSKKLGKVVLTHGDELLFRDPASGDSEFGYTCNLHIVSQKAEVELKAPMRLLTADETSVNRSDVSSMRM